MLTGRQVVGNTDGPHGQRRTVQAHGRNEYDYLMALRCGAAWCFLAGPEDALQSVIVQGFYQGAVPLPTPEAGADEPADLVMHSNRFVLIDPQGPMRAFYDALALDQDQVVRDIRQMAR